METINQKFSELGLHEEFLKRLKKQKIEHPTPIQALSIPILLKGGDYIGMAQTGTGKTLAFVLPLLQNFTQEQDHQALILCPTREIALQTQEVIQKFLKSMDWNVSLVIGGKPIRSQAQMLRKKPEFVVATPGRFADHMERGNVDPQNFHRVVLDEADHMFDLGFLPQVRHILSALPKERQTMMFSATFPASIERLARRFMKDPEKVAVTPPGTAAEGIEHELFLLETVHKRQAVIELINPEESTLIFTRTKLDAEWLSRLLHKKKYLVHALHSDRSQATRIRALENFKKGKTKILVATDIMARGIDVVGIAHVINFDIPQNPEDYIHRVGRTARAKATGRASTLATWREMEHVAAIEKKLGEKLPRKEVSGIPAWKEPAIKSVSSRGNRRKRLRIR